MTYEAIGIIMLCTQNDRIHTLISKLFPIQIVLIRVAFHGMYSYFKLVRRLPFLHTFDTESTDLHQCRF